LIGKGQNVNVIRKFLLLFYLLLDLNEAPCSPASAGQGILAKVNKKILKKTNRRGKNEAPINVIWTDLEGGTGDGGCPRVLFM